MLEGVEYRLIARRAIASEISIWWLAHGAFFNFRTLFGRIFNSTTVAGVRRLAVSVKVQPSGA